MEREVENEHEEKTEGKGKRVRSERRDAEGRATVKEFTRGGVGGLGVSVKHNGT